MLNDADQAPETLLSIVALTVVVPSVTDTVNALVVAVVRLVVPEIVIPLVISPPVIRLSPVIGLIVMVLLVFAAPCCTA